MRDEGPSGEGYGQDWSLWDAWRRGRFPEALDALGEPVHGNLEVFRSPKGRWMAFHADDYADVRVFDLESGGLVATHVYQKGEAYGHTVNISTYVPSFRRGVEHGRTCWRPVHATGLEPRPDFVEEDLWSMPLAFNAWTVWACDYNQMVDVLDLTRIDEGVIALFEREPFVTTIGAGHVRDFVRANLSYTLDTAPVGDDPTVLRLTGGTGADRGRYVCGFHVLVEDETTSFEVDMREGASRVLVDPNGSGRSRPIGLKPSLPWEEVAGRMAAHEAGRREGGDAATAPSGAAAGGTRPRARRLTLGAAEAASVARGGRLVAVAAHDLDVVPGDLVWIGEAHVRGADGSVAFDPPDGAAATAGHRLAYADARSVAVVEAVRPTRVGAIDAATAILLGCREDDGAEDAAERWRFGDGAHAHADAAKAVVHELIAGRGLRREGIVALVRLAAPSDAPTDASRYAFEIGEAPRGAGSPTPAA